MSLSSFICMNLIVVVRMASANKFFLKAVGWQCALPLGGLAFHRTRSSVQTQFICLFVCTLSYKVHLVVVFF
jgi:hypothetical protein